MKELIAIDGNSLLHRAYYALPSMMTHSHVPTGAVYGFLSMLFKLVQRKPDYVVVAFDMHAPTFRHKMYDDYKAGRRPTPEDLRPQFELLKRVLTSMDIAVCECEGYEADDILGTFSRLANKENVFAVLVTGDRDALQLVNDNTHVVLTKKGMSEIAEYDVARLSDEYGLTPERMRDLKGLMGDASDNIPGIPGVGEKTALKLLHEYGSLEAVLAAAPNISGKLGEKITNNVDLAHLSLTLGTIDTCAPIKLSVDDTKFNPSTLKNGEPIVRELEMLSLLSRFPTNVENVPALEESKRVLTEHVKISTIDMLKGLIGRFELADTMAIYINGSYFSIAVDEFTQCDIVANATLFEAGIDMQAVFNILCPILESPTIKKLTFDAKRVMQSLSDYGVKLDGLAFDAMIVDYLLNATNPSGTLKALYEDHFKCVCDDCGAAALFSLYPIMKRELGDLSLEKLYNDIEQPLIKVLFDMQTDGFMLDIQMLKQLSETFGVRLIKLEAEIYALAGEKFNILSPRQLGTILFEKLNLPTQKKTRTGYSTDSEVLEKLSSMHPIVGLVEEYRFLSKLKSTFVDGLITLTIRSTERIHTTFLQSVTATGRISSVEPNLQNIPVRTMLGREIRKAFIASPGNLLVGADYSQIELRLLAHMSGDETMIDAFINGDDIHARTASEVFGVDLASVTKEQRSAAKAVNFGIIYGISDFGLAKNIGVTRNEAKEYISMYLARYSGVDSYMKECILKAQKCGYAETLFGRRRQITELKSANYNTRSFGERVAMNMPLQGTAADIIKLAMVQVHTRLKAEGLASSLILQIHDELIVESPEDEAERVAKLLCEIMQNVIALKVPLIAEASIGKNWYDTK